MSLFLLPFKVFNQTISKASQSQASALIQKNSDSQQNACQIQNQRQAQKTNVLEQKMCLLDSKKRFVQVIELNNLLRGVLVVTYPQRQLSSRVELRLLAPTEVYYKIQNSSMVTEICRSSATFFSFSLARLSNFVSYQGINSATRQVRLHFPPILCGSSRNKKTGFGFSRNEDWLFWAGVRPYLQMSSYLTKKIFENYGTCVPPNLLQGSGRPHFNQVNNYARRISTQSFLTDTFCYQNITKVSKGQKYDKISQAIDKNVSFLSLSLQSIPEKELSPADMLRMKKQIMVQKDSKSSQQTQKREQHGMINYIYTQNNTLPFLQKINQGGFADIYLTQLEYWHLCTKRQELPKLVAQKKLMNPDNFNKRKIVIKKQPQTNVLNLNSQNLRFSNSRIEHQIKVIEQMNEAKPLFAPKYYIIINPKHQLAGSLLMDYLPSKTLTEFLRSYGPSLSLQTKICFMFWIVQALRWLKQQKIVHLDLKPSNILMDNSAFVKIIDFGQSYHPSLNIKQHIPGYSPPYSSPEIYNELPSFSDKSDIFSMGVIFYQMLYGRSPFEIYASTTQIPRTMSHCDQICFLVPEDCETYGYPQVISILTGIICKCLRMKPQERPDLDWTALVLRQLMDLIH